MASTCSRLLLPLLLLLCLAPCAAETCGRAVRASPARRHALLRHSHAAAHGPSTVALGKLRGGGGAEFTMDARSAWALLFSATGFELASTGFMHKAQGFSKPWPSFFAVLFYGMSFYIFNLSLRGIEISVAYSVP